MPPTAVICGFLAQASDKGGATALPRVQWLPAVREHAPQPEAEHYGMCRRQPSAEEELV